MDIGIEGYPQYIDGSFPAASHPDCIIQEEDNTFAVLNRHDVPQYPISRFETAKYVLASGRAVQALPSASPGRTIGQEVSDEIPGHFP